MIQYVNILTKEGKSLLFRDYGTSEVDRNLADILCVFSGFTKEISQSDVKSTQTENFKYFFTKIDTIIIFICADLEDDDNSINSKILTIKTRFIEKYGKILENGKWVGNRSLFYGFEKELDDLFLGTIKTSILGFGSVGKTELTKFIRGKDVDLEYVPTINADIASYEGDEFGDLIFLEETEEEFVPRAKTKTSSHWKLKLEVSKLKKEERREFIISCPMCNVVGKENFNMFEDKSKVLSYIHVVPIYAKKYKCKRCGYEF
ncbi:MAG: hypothetical protein ACTSO8_03100 [Promethearchaeota archaeon]